MVEASQSTAATNFGNETEESKSEIFAFTRDLLLSLVTDVGFSDENRVSSAYKNSDSVAQLKQTPVETPSVRPLLE